MTENVTVFPQDVIASRGIRWTLFASFTIVVSMTMLVGGLAIWRFSSTAAREEFTIQHVEHPIAALSEMRALVYEDRIALRDGLLTSSTAERQADVAKAAQLGLRIDSMGTVLSGAISDPHLQQQLQAFTTAWEAYQRYQEEIGQLETSQRDTEARAMLAGPARQAYGSVAAQLESLVTGLDHYGEKMAAESRRATHAATVIIIVCTLIAIGLGSLIAVRITSSIAGPLTQAVNVLKRVEAGDLTARLAYTARNEVGQMATALNTSLDAICAAMNSMRESSEGLSAAAVELTAVSRSLDSNATSTSHEATEASNSSDQVSENINTIASATHEFSSSIKEIARSSAEAARVASGAVATAAHSSAVVTRLGTSSTEIEAVSRLINTIAQQTNLLALNATIEAARAGDAGKGFAVVAHEVKELAEKTSQATAEIARSIGQIQTDSREAVAALGEISTVIGQINDIQSSIASAVEEQTATTSEISRHISDAARGGEGIAESVRRVAQTAETTAAGASQTQAASAELSRLAQSLNEAVRRFQVDVPHRSVPAHLASASQSAEYLARAA